MKVKEILKIVCEFVGEKELLFKLSSDEALNEKEQEKLDTMLRCFNLVNQEIASDYLPYITKEEIACGEILNFSALSKRVINIYKIKNSFGKSLKFKMYPNFVEIEGNAKTIVYSFLPQNLDILGEVEEVNGLSERVFAYGVASEYLLIDGLGEDAEIWESRFKQSLFVLSRKRGEHILPARSWR